MPEAQSRLGRLTYEESQVFRMVGGLIGVPDAERFILLESPEVEPLKWLVSVEGPELSLPVIDPRLLISDYQPRLEDEHVDRLELTSESDLLPLAITVLTPEPEDSTANLRAPIVINTAKMLAAQIVPAESAYSISHPLLPPSSR